MREDWVKIKYKEAVVKISTSKQKLKQVEYLQAGKIPVIDQGQQLIGGYTEEEYRVLECRLPVVIFGDHTKIIKLINFPFAPGADGTKVLEPIKFILPKYLAYLTEILIFKIKDKGYARHYQHVEKEFLPLASIPEQRAIVRKIETLFASLDRGIADLKTAQEQLKVYRQAVLKKAFEGGFTNKNVQDGELPEGWKWVKLSYISKILSGFAFKSKDFCEEGVPVIKITNVGYSEFTNKEQQYLPFSFLSEYNDYAVYGNDLLIALTRPITNNTTKVCMYPNNATIGLLNQRVACIKDISINKQYLFSFFQTDIFKKYIRSKFSETLQPNLSPKDLSNAPIPLPQNLTEQHAIVREIESRLSVCDKVEQSITEALEKAEALRQSILKKAFEGRLLSEAEIAKCKQEADYEPAARLLEKIRGGK